MAYNNTYNHDEKGELLGFFELLPQFHDAITPFCGPELSLALFLVEF